METKLCPKCNQTKPLSDFYRNYTDCIACVRAYQKRYYDAHYASPQKDPTGYRTCKTCKELKPLAPEYFYRLKTDPKGFSRDCKVCNDASKKRRRARKRGAPGN